MYLCVFIGNVLNAPIKDNGLVITYLFCEIGSLWGHLSRAHSESLTCDWTHTPVEMHDMLKDLYFLLIFLF